MFFPGHNLYLYEGAFIGVGGQNETVPDPYPAGINYPYRAVCSAGISASRSKTRFDEKSPLLTSARFGQEPHFRGEKRQQNKSVTMPRAER